MVFEQNNNVEMGDGEEDSSMEEMDEGDRLGLEIEHDDEEVEIINEAVLVPKSSQKLEKGKGKEI